MTEHRQENITFGSLNTRGFSQPKADYVKELIMNHCDILLIQEHWFHDAHLAMMANMIGHDINVYGVSGMPDDQLIHGRRYGGCALVVKPTLKCNVEPLRSDSRRLFSCILSVCEVKILLHNVYMPCDSNYDADNLF